MKKSKLNLVILSKYLNKNVLSYYKFDIVTVRGVKYSQRPKKYGDNFMRKMLQSFLFLVAISAFCSEAKQKNRNKSTLGKYEFIIGVLYLQN